ncbi:MAG: hypothetical protein ABJC13_22690 [Acidobacteriota bacterium]
MNLAPASSQAEANGAAETRSEGRSLRRAAPDLVSALVILALVPLLFGGVLHHGFIEDDLPLVGYAKAHPPVDYFLRPEAIRQLPWRVLAPLQILSLDFDQHLFGLSPRGFYAHHLAALALAALAVFALLRIWLRPGGALFGALLFLLGPPVATVANELMDRHYLEGLVLAAAAAGVWVLGLRRDRWALAGAAAALFLAAAAAKEIYVPLPILLAALPEANLTTRLRHLAPLAAALAGYLLWRDRMLGGIAAAYGFGSLPGDLPSLAVRWPGQVAEAASRAPWAAALIALAIAGAVYFAVRSLRSAGFLAVTLAVLALPLVPVSKTIRPRYLLLPWLVVAIVLAFVASEFSARFGGRPARALALGVVLVLAFAGHRGAWSKASDRGERLSAETRFAATATGEDLLSHPLAEPFSLAAASAMLRTPPETPEAPRPAWFYDDLYLCTQPIEGRRIWVWDERGHRLFDGTAGIPARRDRYRRSIRWRAPLSVEIRYRRGVLRWKLGPPRPGQYSLLLGDGVAAYPVAPEDRLIIGPPRGQLRVSFRSPQGWVTYSDPLAVDFAQQENVEWSRAQAVQEK